VCTVCLRFYSCRLFNLGNYVTKGLQGDDTSLGCFKMPSNFFI
jgi:hypothetical protein